MSSGDRELGMGRNISRRDFVQGAAAMGALACALPDGGSLLPERDSPRRPYAPAASGLRGSQPGSFEVAQQGGRTTASDFEERVAGLKATTHLALEEVIRVRVVAVDAVPQSGREG